MMSPEKSAAIVLDGDRMGREGLGRAFQLRAHNDDDGRNLLLGQRRQHMADQRTAGDLMHDLGQRGLHARAEAGSEDNGGGRRRGGGHGKPGARGGNAPKMACRRARIKGGRTSFVPTTGEKYVTINELRVESLFSPP
jgi:hypothetical protein